MSECRNCGALGTRDLGFIGEIAPFFPETSAEPGIWPCPFRASGERVSA